MDVSYLPPEDVGVHVYSLYHSVYDSFYAVDNFLDPEYKVRCKPLPFQQVWAISYHYRFCDFTGHIGHHLY